MRHVCDFIVGINLLFQNTIIIIFYFIFYFFIKKRLVMNYCSFQCFSFSVITKNICKANSITRIWFSSQNYKKKNPIQFCHIFTYIGFVLKVYNMTKHKIVYFITYNDNVFYMRTIPHHYIYQVDIILHISR